MSKSEEEMLRNEIEVMKVAKHPNLVNLLDVFESAKYLCIVMEWIQGVDLFEYLVNENFELRES